MAISVVVCCALVVSVVNCFLLFRSHGAFQCPSVLCGSFACFAGIGMCCPVSESLIWSGVAGSVRSGDGVPLGANENLNTWYEHLGNSSFPPEHQSKSFHACASVCMFVIISSNGISCCGWKLLYVPVLSSTKPTIEILIRSCPSGLANVAPWEIEWWTSHRVDDMNNQMLGELPLPWPLP